MIVVCTPLFFDVDTYHSILRWELTLLSTWCLSPPKREHLSVDGFHTTPLQSSHLCAAISPLKLFSHCYSYSKGGGSGVSWMSPTQKHPCPNSEKSYDGAKGPRTKQSLQSHPAQVTRQNSIKILQLDQNMAPFFEKKNAQKKRKLVYLGWCLFFVGLIFYKSIVATRTKIAWICGLRV